jgi:hypothetical protein
MWDLERSSHPQTFAVTGLLHLEGGMVRWGSGNSGKASTP